MKERPYIASLCNNICGTKCHNQNFKSTHLDELHDMKLRPTTLHYSIVGCVYTSRKLCSKKLQSQSATYFWPRWYAIIKWLQFFSTLILSISRRVTWIWSCIFQGLLNDILHAPNLQKNPIAKPTKHMCNGLVTVDHDGQTNRIWFQLHFFI